MSVSPEDHNRRSTDGEEPLPIPGLPADQQPSPAKRGVVTIAALGLTGITGAAVGGLVYAVVVNGADTAALGTIASIGVGSLATLAGTRALSSMGDTRKSGGGEH